MLLDNRTLTITFSPGWQWWTISMYVCTWGGRGGSRCDDQCNDGWGARKGIVATVFCWNFIVIDSFGIGGCYLSVLFLSVDEGGQCERGLTRHTWLPIRPGCWGGWSAVFLQHPLNLQTNPVVCWRSLLLLLRIPLLTQKMTNWEISKPMIRTRHCNKMQPICSCNQCLIIGI